MDLSIFMNNGIQNIQKAAARFYMKSGKGRRFIMHAAAAFHKSSQMRKEYKEKGIHIPPFLIASIASECNLRCAGCYARAAGGCGSAPAQEMMETSDWKRIFDEACKLGVSFILLAGGEPLLRRDVIELAAEQKDIIFPVFTNGTMIGQGYLQLFDDHRNLIPVLSIEGSNMQTDARRGQGVAEKVWDAAKQLDERGILYGVSITVTSKNQKTVTEQSYVSHLREHGCGLIFYIEYVPVEENTEDLVLSERDLKELQICIDRLRADKQNQGTILLSFPGDEEAMGGCLAAGRGFFHINPNGGAEPCPFSPYSEVNVKQQTILEVLQSSFFKDVRKISMSEAMTHKGGCTLFEHKEEVEDYYSDL